MLLCLVKNIKTLLNINCRENKNRCYSQIILKCYYCNGIITMLLIKF